MFTGWTLGSLGTSFQTVQPASSLPESVTTRTLYTVFSSAVFITLSGEIWKRAERAMSELPTDDNPYLRYTILGSFDGVLPHYAREENFERIRSRLDRLRFVQGAPSELAREDGGYDFLNLSDIFEYMGPDLFRGTVDELTSRSAPGAVYAYYNMMLPRALADVRPGSFTSDAERADSLFAENQAFFYGAYHVDVFHP